MGFFFYITDFWFWRWKRLFSLIRLRLDKSALRCYYINFFFCIYAVAPLWKSVEDAIESE
ncbi:MAG: hypothetical protein NZM06_01665 [Chloroherpetonaceae bacterium]|nr:hypothetical protein [Chloroherpetonaceae bacterium]MDW8436629.1 hypothetical protein [Chloroherpetonaceae bacterium]